MRSTCDSGESVDTCETGHSGESGDSGESDETGKTADPTVVNLVWSIMVGNVEIWWKL